MTKLLIQHSNKELIQCLCECILNILNGNVQINDSAKEKLLKFKKILRHLLKKDLFKHKKKILIQHGSSILPILLPTIISTIASLWK